MSASQKAEQIELRDCPVIRVLARFIHSLCRAMYHIADANKMVKKCPGSYCAGPLDQRSLRGISARDIKWK